jgi:hypothetical protein
MQRIKYIREYLVKQLPKQHFGPLIEDVWRDIQEKKWKNRGDAIAVLSLYFGVVWASNLLINLGSIQRKTMGEIGWTKEGNRR